MKKPRLHPGLVINPKRQSIRGITMDYSIPKLRNRHRLLLMEVRQLLFMLEDEIPTTREQRKRLHRMSETIDDMLIEARRWES
jgi:hypothetical protein